MSAVSGRKRRRVALPLMGGQSNRLSVSLVMPRLGVGAARQNVASYAHRHGVVLTRQGSAVGGMAAVTLCRILRAAVENTTGERRQRAESLVRAVAHSLQGQGGPLCVPLPVINVLRRYARRRGSAPAAHAGRRDAAPDARAAAGEPRAASDDARDAHDTHDATVVSDASAAASGACAAASADARDATVAGDASAASGGARDVPGDGAAPPPETA